MCPVKWFRPSIWNSWNCISSPVSSFGLPSAKERADILKWVHWMTTWWPGAWSTNKWRPYHCLQLLHESGQAEPDSSSRGKVKRQGPMGPSCSKENSIRYTEEILHKDSQTLEWRLRGLWNLHPWRHVLLVAGDHRMTSRAHCKLKLFLNSVT